MVAAVHDGTLILLAGGIAAAGLLASLFAARVRVPSLVLVIGLGMLLGSEGIGGIEFDDYELARTVGIVALALILFEGGLTSGLLEIRPVLASAISLALVGTVITAAVVGLTACLLLDLDVLEGLLLGSIVASTDGAAIFALLRGSTLRRRLARTLEAESGFNDPVAVLLVVGFSEWILEPGYGALDMLGLLAQQLALGLAVGLGFGWLAVEAFRRLRLSSPGLYPVASLAVAAIAYGGADSLGGSGFLAVYLAGLALGTATIPAKATITSFHDGLAWIAQLTLFLTLGLLVFPSHLDAVAIEGTVLALVLVFVARPVAAAVATAFGSYRAAERLVLGWAGLRGAVPVVLATFPVIDGVPHSLEFFDIVFFVVVLSTLLQGATFEGVARRLGLTTSTPALPRPIAEAGTIRGLGAEVLEYPVADGDAIAGARVRDLGLPRDGVVSVIVRGDSAIPPRGSTRLRAGDRLHVLVRQESAREVRHLIERWRRGPIGPTPRPDVPVRGHAPMFSVGPWRAGDGDPGHPDTVGGVQVVERMRIRRDEPGALLAIADGRFAISGALLAVGPREQVIVWARRRIARVDEDEAAGLQTVVGALAADSATRRRPRSSPS